MPSVIANEDHPMGNAPEAEANPATNADGGFIDLNDQRIRVVSQLISLLDPKLLISLFVCSCPVQLKQQHPSNLSQKTIL